MRQLLPAGEGEVDLATAYAYDGPRAVRANMVASADGAATYEGRSGGLGNEADRRLFHLLRALADVVLVGAATVRLEGYGPARPSADHQERRRTAGLAPVPPIAVVTTRVDLDLESRFFAEAVVRPIVVTTMAAPAERRAAASDLADVVVAGVDSVDVPRMLDALADRGLGRVLTEGGPRLLAQIAAARRLDELCLTVAPCVIAGAAPRILAGPVLAQPLGFALRHVLEDDGALFLRYVRVP